MLKSKSVIRRYLYLSLGVGFLMGLIFPPFASIFTTYKRPGYILPFSLLCISAGIFVGVVSFFIGRVTLISAIRILKKNFNQASSGDLTVHIDMVSNDEIGEIIVAFNQFMSSLERTMKQICSSAREIDKLSEHLAKMANMTKNSSEQVANSIGVIATGAAEQNASVDKIREQVLNSVSRIDNGFKRVDKMLKESQNSSEAASRGRDSVKQVIEQFSWIADTAAFAADSIENLGRRSKEIGEITKTITNVSDQTKMLSLNASMEAARAGAEGRGFSVVAEEVGKLALSSADASRKIEELLFYIQKETDSAVLSMEKNLGKVNTNIMSIKRSEESLDNIVESVIESKNDVNELFMIYSEIQKVFRSIETAIDKIHVVISDNASCSEQVAASASEQSTAINELASDSNELYSLSSNLKDEIRKFKFDKTELQQK